MIIRKITKQGRSKTDGTRGRDRIRYVVDYVDANGRRHQPVFATEKAAKAHQARVIVEMAGGVHVADSDSITLDEGYEIFKAALERAEYSRSARENHRIYYDGHVKPFLGGVKMTTITPVAVKQWTIRLAEAGRTKDTIRRAKITLGAVFDEAIGDGNAATNPAKQFRKRRDPRRLATKEKRKKVTIPARDIVREVLALAADQTRWAIVRRLEKGVWTTLEQVDVAEAASDDDPDPTTSVVVGLKRKYGVPPGVDLQDWRIESWVTARWVRPFLALLSFGGVRIGEARGMRWPAIDWRLSTMTIENAVDRFGEEGELKTDAAHRKVKIGPMLRQTLRAWWEACGSPADGYVFPSSAGTPLGYSNIVNRHLNPLWLRLAHKHPKFEILGQNGLQQVSPHHLRHFAVSLWAAEGKTPTEIAERVGHKDATVTLRIYWHLFEQPETEEEDEQLAAAERSVFGLAG